MDCSISPKTSSGRSKQTSGDDGVSPKKRSNSKYDSDSEFNQNGKMPASDDAGNRRKSSKPRRIARSRSSESCAGIWLLLICLSLH